LDSCAKTEDIIKKAVSLGMQAVCQTNHGNCAGSYDFYNTCKENNIKPVLGNEFYYTPFDRTILELDKYGQKYNHLLLLAKNNDGLQNIFKMSSLAYKTGFYYKPRIDNKLLEEYGQDCILTSACLASPLNKLRVLGSESSAEKLLCYFNDLFKDNFYLEVMDLPYQEQDDYNHWLLKMAKKYNIPMILTCDVHYVNKEDGGTPGSLHEQYICIGIKDTVNNPDRKFSFVGCEHYLKSEEEARLSFNVRLKGFPDEIITNTQYIADQCTGEYFSHIKDMMPRAIGVVDSRHTLKCKAQWGLVDRFGGKVEDVPTEYKQRLDHELDVINRMGYNDYFLIVEDYVNEAKRRGFQVGPGRGSVAGSLVAWSLKITGKHVDPIKYGLLFTRFLNEGRKGSAPDVDVDFNPKDREELIQYCVNKYGDDNVYHIGTRREYKPKSLAWDLGRVLGYSIDNQKRAAKLVPEDIQGRSPTMEDVIKESPLLIKDYPDIVESALKLDRVKANTGVHAAGIVISKEPLAGYIPTYKTGTCERITEFNMKEVEKLGLVKFDFLVLDTLTTLKKALEYIKKNHNIDINLDEIPIDDDDAYKIMRDGHLEGIFQLEDSLAYIATAIQPRKIMDVSFITSAGRPGPKDSGVIQKYLDFKNEGIMPDLVHKKLEEILKDNNYCIIYQEQVMEICQKMAGFTLSEADIMRKAMGKKNLELMAELKDKFIDGCIDISEMSKGKAEELFVELETFANYGFNACLVGETKLKNSKDGTITIDEIKTILNNNTKINLLSFLNDNFVEDECINIIDTGEQEVIEIELENGEKVICTKNHKFLCSDNVMHTVEDIIDKNLDMLVMDNL